jgi:hypothetical protein
MKPEHLYELDADEYDVIEAMGPEEALHVRIRVLAFSTYIV